MKVFVAGGSGAIGRRLVPLLVSVGHDVSATTRTQDGARLLYELGARPVVVDALDREAVLVAVAAAEPEVIVNQLTGLAGESDLRSFDKAFAATNRLRTAGTAHLVEAARMSGVRRLVAQSFGNWNYERAGRNVKHESDPFDAHPPRSMRETLAAIGQLETAVLGAEGVEGVALRYGNLYGPGTGIAEGGEMLELVWKRKLPVIGSGDGIWSFVHVDDAASATLAAVERGAPGVYNVADDVPAPARVWIPELARILGADPPRHIPEWLGRLAAGPAIVSMMTRIRGASNARARRELGWRLRHPSWRDGFRDGLGDEPVGLPATSELGGG